MKTEQHNAHSGGGHQSFLAKNFELHGYRGGELIMWMGDSGCLRGKYPHRWKR